MRKTWSSLGITNEKKEMTIIRVGGSEERDGRPKLRRRQPSIGTIYEENEKTIKAKRLKGDNHHQGQK